jgi:hypothetical protein
MLFRQRLFNKNKWLWISLTVFLATYVFVVGMATYHYIYYQWDLNRYDLDNDRFFGRQKITEDQEAAMQRLTYDAGRNYSFATGFIFSSVVSGTVYVFGRLKSRLIKS